MSENDNDDGLDEGDLDPSSNETLRRFAELEVERQSASIDRLLDQHVADFRWLTASLLLLNSGASVAVLNSVAVSNSGKMVSGSLYLVGIALALFIGIASQLFARKALTPNIEYRIFWLHIAQGELFDAAEEQAVIGKIQSATKYSWVVPCLGWLSGFAFLTGSTFAGTNLVEIKPAVSMQEKVTLTR